MVEMNLDKMTQEEKARIGNLISEKRKEKGLSYYKIRQNTGIDITQVQAVESGDKNPTIDTIIKLLLFLEIPYKL